MSLGDQFLARTGSRLRPSSVRDALAMPRLDCITRVGILYFE